MFAARSRQYHVLRENETHECRAYIVNALFSLVSAHSRPPNAKAHTDRVTDVGLW